MQNFLAVLNIYIYIHLGMKIKSHKNQGNILLGDVKYKRYPNKNF